MGHDAVADLEQHVERAVRRAWRGSAGRACGRSGCRARAGGRSRGSASRRSGTCSRAAGRKSRRACAAAPSWRASRRRRAPPSSANWWTVFDRSLQRQPAIGREAVADLAGAVDGAVDRAEQARRDRRSRRRCRTARDSPGYRPGAAGPGWRSRPAAHCRRAGCAPCLRSARHSGRARSGCRRRGWAGCPAWCGAKLSPSCGSSVSRSTGLSLTTQTSAAWPPRCMAMAVGVERRADAGEAARHDGPALRRARQIDAQGCRPRLEPAVDIDRRGRQRHRFLADEVAAVAFDARDQRGAFAPASASSRALVCVVILEGKPCRQAGPIIMRSKLASTCCALASSCPHHQVAMLGSSSSSPSKRAQMLRQEGEQRPRLEDAGAERVDHRNRALAQRLDQAGRADAASRGAVPADRRRWHPCGATAR